MADIVIERDDQNNTFKLDSDEQALFEEIQISTEKPLPKRKPPSRKKPRPAFQEESADLEAFTNPSKMSAPTRPPPEVMDHGEDEGMPMFEEESDQGGGEYMGGGGEYEGGGPSPGYTSIEDEKADLLNKISRLEKKGLNVNKKLNIYSSVEDLRTEYKRIRYSIDVEQSIKFSRRMLIACVTGVEFLNKRYNPLEIQLDGWSESVMENVDDYDGVFEELYNKYKTKVNVAPEVKLIMMLGGSAMMFHLTNSMFKSAIPNMNDVMKQNPDLVKNMMSAVQNTQPRTTMEDPTQRPTKPAETFDSTGRREMNGPGLDISQLMGGIMMPPPPPMNTNIEEEKKVQLEEVISDVDDLSDIVSIAGESTNGEVKEVSLKKSRGRKKSKKNEINL
jgi:hypothetical protein